MTDSPTPRKPRARRLKAAGLAFVPVPLARKRHDGWSPGRQQHFLVALNETGVVASAARAAGMSAKSAYRLRDRPGAASFATAWDRLLRESRDRAYDSAVEIVLSRRLVPRTYRGLFVGLKTANTDSMILAVMRARNVAGRRGDGVPPPGEIDRFLSGKGHQ